MTRWALIFAVFFASTAQAVRFDARLDAECRARLEKALCYADSVDHWSRNPNPDILRNLKKYQERTCLPLPASHRNDTLEVYRQLPSEVKLAFCEIKKFFIIRGDDDFGARAEYHFDPKAVRIQENDFGMTQFRGVPNGFVLEISEKHRYLLKETAAQFISRTTQARYGRQVVRDGLSPDLPVAHTRDSYGPRGSLARTVIHEIGHLLSRANRMTDIFFQPISSTPWSDHSWNMDGFSMSPKGAAHEIWERILSRGLSTSDLHQSLEFLTQFGSPSFYGTTNPEEDFAEAFLYYFHRDLQLKIGEKVVFDLAALSEANPRLRRKFRAIRQLLEKDNPYSLKDHGPIGGELVR